MVLNRVFSLEEYSLMHSKLVYYTIWEILFGVGYIKSRWACKYCMTNETNELKHLIEDSMHACVYCCCFHNDPEIAGIIKDPEAYKTYKECINGELSESRERKLVMNMNLILR